MNKRIALPATSLLLAMCLALSVNAQEPQAAADEQTTEEATEATEAVEAAEAPAAAEPAAAPASAGSGDLSAAVREAVGTPAEGKALVVFFRPSKFAGAAISFKVRENDVELGQLKSGNYFTQQVEPGAHAYVVHSEAKDITNLEFEAGETYFVAASISMGFMAGRPNLSPSDASAFEAALPKLKKSKPLH